MLALTSSPPPPSGLLAFQCDRTFQRRIEERVARRRPHVIKRDKVHDQQFSFPPATGVAGQTQSLTITPQCLFRGDKIIAIDDAVPPGSGTRITGLFVGQLNQMPAGGNGLLTSFLGPGNLGNGIKWSICQPALSISMQVEFLKNCTFNASIFGKAIL